MSSVLQLTVILVGASLAIACQTPAAPAASSPTNSEGAAVDESAEPSSQLASAPSSQPTTRPTSEPTSQPSADAPRPAMVPDPSWVAARAGAAESRLQATEPGRLVWRAIETHGGLAAWFEAGPIHFRFDYQPIGDGTRRDSRQVIDTWSARAWHQLVADESATFGWTGDVAWATFDPDGAPVRPRFWSLTPYYFLAMPFVAADPGVVLTVEGDGDVDGVAADLVRVAYEAGVGDAPDDYYILYLAQDDGRLLGLRYVVSYPGFFPEGGHTPEKFMRFDGLAPVDGLVLARSLPTYQYDAEEDAVGEQVTAIDVTEIRFVPDTDPALFEVGEGGTVLEGW